MAVPEGGPQTPENFARNEAIPRAPGRRQNLQAETLRTPVVEFPPLDDGKRISYQMVAKLVNGLNTAIIQQTNTIETNHPERTEREIAGGDQALRTQIENQATTNLPPKPWAEVASAINPSAINIIP
ncbi:hypothetical protein TSTA_109340 [Talaromyces stipitatus ATCC 10500]|uniref:Uncharacterized protein n=1 Tax=Talaromyces stipitatus (strain ATCC 10500 / CBS 375.48 / QM 6759 / NRRL 1006) TaxID=441959 RepID=B8MV39_TALSN|nr:uncharacterized protein TSTA_109340 [Talaromyces stipitatus ATCC 10500]EED11755.1 hypothetical protein TSTA_109340 [Talaromyces stipitatus ATCC 10500]